MKLGTAAILLSLGVTQARKVSSGQSNYDELRKIHKKLQARKANGESNVTKVKSDTRLEHEAMWLEAGVKQGMMPLLVDYATDAGMKTCADMEHVEMVADMKMLHVASMLVPMDMAKEMVVEMSLVKGVNYVEMDHIVYATPFLRSDGKGGFVEIDTEDVDVKAQAKQAGAIGTDAEYNAVPGVVDVQSLSLLQRTDLRTAAMRTVCVCDTGYALGHSDLPGLETGITGTDTPDGIAFEDVGGSGHGTHVSGTIGAIGNGEGVVGVNPDPSRFRFHIGKALNSMTGSGSSTLTAVNGCLENGSHVINLSLGSSFFSTIANNAYQNAYDDGVLVVAAAGNSGNSAFSYPASFTSVMSVAAVGKSFGAPEYSRVSFSQFNSQTEISGPGSFVLSTDNDFDSSSPFATTTLSGTSMACPHVAGVATLVWSYFPECTNEQIRNALLLSSRDLGEFGCEDEHGYGLVQAEAAYDLLAAEGCGVGDTGLGAVGGCGQLLPSGLTAPPTPAPTNFDCPPAKTFRLDLVTDIFGSETAWQVNDDATGALLFSSGGEQYADSSEFEFFFCKTTAGCATFTITDSFGDGICCSFGQGSYELTYGGVSVGEGGDFGSSESTQFGCSDDGSTEGPTMPQPTIAPTTAPPTGAPTTAPPTAAPTPSPTVAPTTASPTNMPTPSPTPDLDALNCASNQVVMTVTITTDMFPAEIKWSVENVLDSICVALPKVEYTDRFTLYTEAFCVNRGAFYRFNIHDASSDGLCCEFGEGSYSVSTPDRSFSGGDFGEEASHKFWISSF
jgi:serine protease